MAGVKGSAKAGPFFFECSLQPSRKEQGYSCCIFFLGCDHTHHSEKRGG